MWFLAEKRMQRRYFLVRIPARNPVKDGVEVKLSPLEGAVLMPRAAQDGGVNWS